MIRIKTLLTEMEEDKNPNIASIDDEVEWKWPDVEHLFSMNFDREGDSVFLLKNPPMKVYKIKRGPFILEEPIENHSYSDYKKGTEAPIQAVGLQAFEKSKEIKKYSFSSFIDLINFFDEYDQEIFS